MKNITTICHKYSKFEHQWQPRNVTLSCWVVNHVLLDLLRYRSTKTTDKKIPNVVHVRVLLRRSTPQRIVRTCDAHQKFVGVLELLWSTLQVGRERVPLWMTIPICFGVALKHRFTHRNSVDVLRNVQIINEMYMLSNAPILALRSCSC